MYHCCFPPQKNILNLLHPNTLKCFTFDLVRCLLPVSGISTTRHSPGCHYPLSLYFICSFIMVSLASNCFKTFFTNKVYSSRSGTFTNGMLIFLTFLSIISPSGWEAAGSVRWRCTSRGGHLHVWGPWHHGQWLVFHPLLSGLPPRTPEALQGRDHSNSGWQGHLSVVGIHCWQPCYMQCKSVSQQLN